MRKNIFLSAIFLSLIFTSCEDKIDVKLDEGTSQLAVDAFITNQPTTQKIRLTKTSGYFDNSPSPAALGATVKIKNNRSGKTYNFIDLGSSGDYIWIPGALDTIALSGDDLVLSITYSGEQFTATSIMNPAPVIDSITYVYREASPSLEIPAGYFASFYANDFPGTTDFYWIKTYRNDTLNNDPEFMNIAWDAAYGPGADGFTFILPIRDAITPFNKPFRLNDSIKVEIHAINEDTFNFLTEVRTQSTNGGLFATPPANVRTNIKNTNPASEVKAVGFFNAGAVSFLSKTIQ